MQYEPLDLARRIVDVISDLKGEDIVVIDLRDVTPIADYFVICTAGSDRQLKAILSHIADDLREEGYPKPWRVEGNPENGWVLLDYADVVVHAFLEEEREYYNLEGLWDNAKTVLRVQ